MLNPNLAMYRLHIYFVKVIKIHRITMADNISK